MAVGVELVGAGSVLGGFEQWWDDIEAALDGTAEDFPLLASISPYGDVTIPHDRLVDLAGECVRLRSASAAYASVPLTRIADLCRQGVSLAGSELRFVGD